MTSTIRTRRLSASDFDQELLELYDFYAHGMITKHEFVERAGKFAVGGLTALALLDVLSPDYALARQVDPDDPAIRTSNIEYESPKGHGSVRGYPGPSRRRRRQAARRAGCPREPGTESLYQRCCAAHGKGRLHGAGTGRPDLGWRLSRQ